jgi:hypothetical protein
MSRLPVQVGLTTVVTVLIGLALAGCGGDSDSSAADTETEAVATTFEDTETATTAPATTEESSSSTDDGAAPAPGTGTLVLDDGRVFAITVSQCEFLPNGTFTVNGTGDQGATFELTQFYLGEEWSQSQVDLQFPNRDRVYVIVTKATEGAEPATVEGKSVSWTQPTFRELDESANSHVYQGEGTVRVTCA